MRIHRILLVLVLALGTTAALPAHAAHADQVAYAGMHPLPGGGWCYIDAPHVHVYAPPPKAKVAYRMYDGAYYFVGDPVAFHYDGPRYAYYGPHPVYVDVLVGDDDVPRGDDVEYCYINGPHYHYYAPPAGTSFRFKGDAYWYVGAFSPEFKRHRRHYIGINTYYRPIVYERPVVVVDPPVGYIGPIVHVGVVAPGAVVEGGVGGGAVVGAGVGVGVSAGVEVHVPVPTVEVGIGVPGVVVEERGHYHHDNGWHRGHYKRGHIERGHIERRDHRGRRRSGRRWQF